MPTKYTCEEVMRAARAVKTKTATAKALGIDFMTLQAYCKRWPSLEKLFSDLRWELVSLAESGLWKKVESEDFGAITFVLKTLGKSLGYSEKAEDDHSRTGPITITIQGVDPEKDL